MIVIPKIDKKELVRYRQKKPLKEDDLKDLLVFLNPRGEYKGTAILILANMIVFLGMIFAGLNIISPTPQELLEIGGNRRPEVLHGEYWRLFTSTLIHAGLMHLLLNIFGIGLGGVSLEKILGPVKLVFIYIVCGILASLASIYWHENTVSVGASGAIFGLYGLLLAFLIFKIIPKYDRSHFWMLLGLFGGISLLLGIFSAGTDNAGHFGGLFSGFGIGMFLILLNKNGLKKNAR
ncbi:rhomboid family intramembrane serine protease [Kordia sp.]|uniref:rhomboid family intramembrane serine protease n=1 Tax=Kordia sp. TaxID=1965332 RepID=UPI0025BD825B|nr:rhomboid family intramembrane serine protease [Kordia sp.]MCH2192842.1 rhomboid family intramembrane serine protease [Kordia sp.]